MALADFKERVRAYEAVYEELADEEDAGGISYIKVGGGESGSQWGGRDGTDALCLSVGRRQSSHGNDRLNHPSPRPVNRSRHGNGRLNPYQQSTHPFPPSRQQVYNVGQKVVTRNTTGYIPSQIAFYLQNIHIEPRKIWLTRHAESLDQVRCSCDCACRVRPLFPLPMGYIHQPTHSTTHPFNRPPHQPH